MQLSLALSITALRRKANGLSQSNFRPVGADALITSDGKIFRAREE